MPLESDGVVRPDRVRPASQGINVEPKYADVMSPKYEWVTPGGGKPFAPPAKYQDVMSPNLEWVQAPRIAVEEKPVQKQEGTLARQGRYLVDDLRMGWNSLASGYHGLMAAQFGELYEANRAKYGDAPADPTVAQSQAELKAEIDAHMLEIQQRGMDSAALQARGREGTKQFLSDKADKPFLEQARILGDAVVKNPGVIADLGIQSLPSSMAMLATAVAARFGLRSTGAAAASGGATSAAVEFGNDYAALRQQGKSHEEAWRDASIKSSVIGLFDAASMGSAGRALDEVLKRGFAGKVKEISKEVGKQAALGASGEALGSVASGRTPELTDVAAEAIGEVFGAPGEALTTFSGVPATTKAAPVVPPVASPGPVGSPAAIAVNPAAIAVTPPSGSATPTEAIPEVAALLKADIDTDEAKKALERPPIVPTALDRVTDIDKALAAGTGDAAALQAERDSLTVNWPKMQAGVPTRFATESGVDIDAQFAIVNADDLVASHDENLRANPAFPQQLQPRDRERAASELQVSSIVQRLNPARLGESPDAANGAPIIGADGLVESGNARTVALKRVYQANGQKAQDYRDWLSGNAPRFGLTPEQVQAIDKPVLVRVRTTPVNRAEFARQANASTVAQMSPAETANADASRIGSLDDFAPSENGDFNNRDSRAFVSRFVAGLPVTEQGALVGADGRLSQSGYTRIRNAVLAKAYGNSPTLLRIVESLDNNVRNMTTALVRVAPAVAKARESMAQGALHDVDITTDILAAVEELSRLRAEGQSVDEYLSQAGMFEGGLSEESRDLLAFLAENMRSPSRIASFIENYLAALTGAGNPNQGSLLGDASAPSKQALIDAAKQGVSGEEVAEDGEVDPEGGDKSQGQGGGAASAESRQAEAKVTPVQGATTPDLSTEVDSAAHEAATSPENDLPAPTEAQQEAGNYKKGHVKLHGLDISIENPKGSIRSGTDEDGKAWEVTMEHHYGYLKRTEGADGDHVDVFLGDSPDSDTVFIVDQVNPKTGKFDEHKVLLGFADMESAKAAYLANYQKGWKGMKLISAMSLVEFKNWLKDGDTTKPLVLESETKAGSGETKASERDTKPPEPETKPIEPETPAHTGVLTSGEDDVAAPSTKIADAGEKIGGARKDTATSAGPRALPKEEQTEPGWQKRYSVSRIEKSNRPNDVGRWTVRDTRRTDPMGQSRQIGDTFATEEDAKAAVPLIEVARNHQVVVRSGSKGEPEHYVITRNVTDRRRVTVVEQQFPTREDAMRYMAGHAVQIIETRTSFGEEILPRPDKVHRTGAARRTGDVTANDFMSAFGFRGIEFGNWNAQDERQSVMNHAYDALMDLADVMRVPPQAIGLNGELALAFGARGHGLIGARAHYERDYGVINLTKMKGAGSLAHEWFHALDHYFGRQDGKAPRNRKPNERGDLVFEQPSAERAYASHGFLRQDSGVRDELRAIYERLIKTMHTKAETYVQDSKQVERFTAETRDLVAKRLQSLRNDLAKESEHRKRNNKPASAEQLAAFDEIAERIISGEMLETSYRTISQGAGKATSIRWTNDALEQLSAIYKAVRGRSGFDATNQSGVLDDLRGHMKRYGDRLKMLAEAQAGAEKTKRVPTNFAMEAKSIDQGRTGDYWYTEHEMAARAFQAYVEDKVSESGGQSDFLVYGTNRVIPTPWGWKRPFPHGDERTAINAAFDELVAEIKTKTTEQGTALFSRAPRGTDFAAEVLQELASVDELFRYPVSKGTTIDAVMADIDPSVTFEGDATRDDEKAETGADVRWMFKTNKGVSVYVFQRGREVWMDLSRLERGEGGSALYAGAMNYAFNTNRVFIGDPAGLSDAAIVRRTQNMLSSALRFGTTRHMRAAEEQERGSAKAKAAPLAWRDGDDVANVRAMIDTVSAYLEATFPEAVGVRFDFSSGRFVDATTNEPAGGVSLEVLADQRRGEGASKIGSATLRRGVLLRSLLQSGSGERPGILEQVLRRSRELVAQGDLFRIFSRNSNEDPADAGFSASGGAKGKRSILGVKDIEAAIAPIRRAGRGLPPVVTAQHQSQLPKDLQAAIEVDGSVVRGAYHNGSIYLIGDNLASPEEAVFTLLHEAAHYGLEGIFGRELRQVLMKIYVNNTSVRKAVAKLQAMHPKLSTAGAIEEVLADMAGRGERPTFIQQLIAWVRDWFRRREIALKMLDADVLAIIGRAQGYWQRPTKWTHLDTTSFSRRSQSSEAFAADVLAVLSDMEDLYQFPMSEKKSLEGIAADLSPALKVSEIAAPSWNVDRIATVTMPDGAKAMVRIYKDGAVDLDASLLEEGQSRGALLYALVSTYAHNNGKLFIGDPNGLSDAALFRRTEHMIASAMKFDTTEHLYPHERQVAEGLKWEDGKDNLGNLLEFSRALLGKAMPEIADVVYNFRERRFERASDGTQISDAAFDRMSSSQRSGARAARAGRATLKRGALLNTLVRTTSGEGRREVLGDALRQLREGVDPDLRRIFYSRGDAQDGLSVDEVQGVLKAFNRPGSKSIRVAKSVADLPEHARNWIQSQDAEGVRGIFLPSSDEIWIVADGVSSAEEVLFVAMHEGVHRGLRSLFGADIKPILQQIYNTNPSVRQATKQVQEDFGLDLLDAVEEVLADRAMSGSASSLNGWDKLVAFIKKWVADLGRRIGVELTFTDDMVNTLVGAASTIGLQADARVFDDKVAAAYAKLSQAPLRPSSWAVDEPSRLDNIIYSLQDKHVDTKRVMRAITTWSGKVADWIDPYLHEELYHGRTAKRTQQFLNDELNPLLADMKARGVTVDEFEEFLWNRHAEERNRQIAKVNPAMRDGGSGIDTADARAYLAALDPQKRAAYDALAARVDAINAETKATLIGYGLESPDTVAAWESVYDHYVPLMREEMETGFGNGTGSGFSVRGKASKRATGSSRRVVNILGNIALQRERTITRGEKNRVATALWGLARMNPNDDFWKVDIPPTIKSVSDTTGLVETRPDPNYKSRDNVIVARIPAPDGTIHERAVVFNDRDARARRMALALKNLDADSLGVVLGLMAKVTRYFASINTQYNPIFGIVNLFRDVQSGMLNLTSTPLAGKQAQVLKDVMPAMRGIYGQERAGRKGAHSSNRWATLWEEFQREGGQTGYRDMFATGDERAKGIEKALKGLSHGVGMRAGKAVFDWLADYNSAIENSARLAAYKAGLDQGLTPQRAASLAKNLTVNFNRKGQSATQAGAMYAFFNASVQGTARLAQTLAGPKGRKIIAGGIMLGVVQAIGFALAGFDGDEPPQFVRERNVVIPIWDGRYVSIPMPLGLHVLPNIGRIAAEYALNGFEGAGEHVAQLLGVFLEAFNPVGNGTLAQTLSPTMFDPGVALLQNKDWTGKKIYREDFSSLNPTPGFTRTKDTATAWSKALAWAINRMSGGSDFRPGKMSPTPDQIDYLIGQATGGLGREGAKVSQTIESAITGEELPTYKIPLVGRLIGSTEGQASQGNRFYANVTRLAEHEAEIKGRLKSGQDAQEYIAENPEARLWGEANRVERAVSTLRARRRALVEQGAPKDDIRALDQRITDLMKSLNERISAARKAA